MAENVAVELTYCGTLPGRSPGAPPVPIIVLEESEGILPTTSSGTIISGSASSNLFRRGDANGDGTFNGLVDALFLLLFQFVPGSRGRPASRRRTSTTMER